MNGNLQNVGSLIIIFLILKSVGAIVFLTGVGIQGTARNTILGNSDTIVSCETDNLKHLKGEDAALKNAYTLKITGISIITFSLIFTVLITIFNQCYKKVGRHFLCENNIICSTPAVATLAVIAYQLAIYIVYEERLKTNKVAKEYYYYSSIIGLLIPIQIILLFKFIVDKFVVCGSNINSRLYLFVYLLAIINLLLLGIVNVIVKYYSTDG